MILRNRIPLTENVVSIATFVVFVKTFYVMFLRPKPKELVVEGKEVPRAMIFAMGILLLLVIGLGLFPDLVVNGISSFVGGVL